MFWKKAQIFIILIVLSCSSVAWAGTLGDVNGDGTVGIPEAVYALQVASGTRPQTAVSGTYDFAEYFYQNNGIYSFESTYYGGTPETTYSTAVSFDLTTENIDGVNLLTRVERGTYKTYFSVNEKCVSVIGYIYLLNPSQGTTWYTPPRIMGSRNMSIGEVFFTAFQSSPYSGFGVSEYIFAGLETITVPAGTFSDCVKLIIRSYPENMGTPSMTIAYYAKNIGLVKSLSSQSKLELTHARAGGITYPSGTSFYAGQGTWNEMKETTLMASGAFSMVFPSGPTPIKTYLILTNKWPDAPVVGMRDWRVPIQSQDGVHFSGRQTPTEGWHEIPDVALTAQNNSITGIYRYSRQEGDPPVAVTYEVQIDGSYTQLE